MRQVRAILVVMMSAMCCLSGCVPIATESAFRVRGVIDLSSAEVEGPCRLRLCRADDDGVVQEKQVEREFFESFSVEPKLRRYYFVISCGTSEPFRSTVYEFGDMSHYKDPVDLGHIKLAARGLPES